MKEKFNIVQLKEATKRVIEKHPTLLTLATTASLITVSQPLVPPISKTLDFSNNEARSIHTPLSSRGGFDQASLLTPLATPQEIILPTLTPTHTSTNTPTPTPTHTFTPTPTETPTPTVTNSPTPTETPEPTPEPTKIPTPIPIIETPEILRQAVNRRFTKDDVLAAYAAASARAQCIVSWEVGKGGNGYAPWDPYAVGRLGEVGPVQLHPQFGLVDFYKRGYGNPNNPWEAINYLEMALSEGRQFDWLPVRLGLCW